MKLSIPIKARRIASAECPWRGWWMCAAASLMVGCSLPLPQAQNDPTKVYVLSVPRTTESAVPNASAPIVRLRPIELASYLRSRPLVVRRGENEIEFREYARWGEPLEQGISRVLREELLTRGAASAVDAGGIRPSDAGDAKYVVSVRILGCEGGADGAVNFDAMWEITSTAGSGGPVGRGEFRPTGVKWTPRNEATLAAALSHAVSSLAGEIADALAKAK